MLCGHLKICGTKLKLFNAQALSHVDRNAYVAVRLAQFVHKKKVDVA